MDHIVLGDAVAAEDHEALHDVVQLSDVARPLILLHFLQSLICELWCGLSHIGGDGLHETVD